jgi:hypothetical protein
MALERRDPAEGWSDRRAWERVEYGAPPWPQLHMDVAPSAALDVMDCSERGVRVTGALPGGLSTGSDAHGTLVFPSGHRCRVEGVVVRAAEGEFALHFTSLWLERDVILDEKRRLRLEREDSATA